MLWEGLWRYLKAKGLAVQIRHTRCLGDARVLAQKAASDPSCRMVVVAGGDGTVREAADGMAGSGKPMMIVPTGTENLLAGEVGMDDRLAGIISTFERGQVKTVDLGMVNGRCFTSVVGVGFDGQVVRRVNQRRRGHIDYYDYLEPLWHTFWSYKFPSLSVQMDGQDVFSGRGLVFVGNISRYALGLHLLGRARINDGLLDLCIYRCSGRLHLVKHAIMTVLKSHIACRDVFYATCRQVIIEATSKDIPCQMDGDPGPDLPLKIAVNRSALRLLVPVEGRPIGVRRSLLRAFR